MKRLQEVCYAPDAATGDASATGDTSAADAASVTTTSDTGSADQAKMARARDKAVSDAKREREARKASDAKLAELEAKLATAELGETEAARQAAADAKARAEDAEARAAAAETAVQTQLDAIVERIPEADRDIIPELEPTAKLSWLIANEQRLIGLGKKSVVESNTGANRNERGGINSGELTAEQRYAAGQVGLTADQFKLGLIGNFTPKGNKHALGREMMQIIERKRAGQDEHGLFSDRISRSVAVPQPVQYVDKPALSGKK